MTQNILNIENGRYICYGSTKLKEYFKFSDVTKIFKFGSFVWDV